MQRRSITLTSAAVGAAIAGALLVGGASPASAHFTCADGTPVMSDDPNTACEGHGGVAGSSTTAAPTTAPGPTQPGVTTAPPTTRRPGATTTTTRKRPATAPGAVTARPRFTG